MSNHLIDTTINYYLTMFNRYKPADMFHFRESVLSNVSGADLFHIILLCDYGDTEKLFNYCRDISGKNYSLKQKRNKFINTIF